MERDLDLEDDGLHDDLASALEGTNWTARLKDDAGDTEPADTEPADDEPADDLRRDLEAAMAEAQEPTEQPAEADDGAAWARELRRLADAGLARNGVDPSRRHEAGLSRREAARRLFNAEKMLHDNPAEALPKLIRDYAGRRDDGTRRAIAYAALQALGYQTPAALDEGSRSRLAQLEAWYGEHSYAERRAHEQAIEQARQTARDKVEAFRSAAPHLDRVREQMAQLIVAGAQAGKPLSLEDAYDRAVWGDPELRKELTRAEQEKLAKQAGQARREHAAAAQKARTPRTASVSAEAPSDQPLRDDLRDGYRAMVAG